MTEPVSVTIEEAFAEACRIIGERAVRDALESRYAPQPPTHTQPD